MKQKMDKIQDIISLLEEYNQRKLEYEESHSKDDDNKAIFTPPPTYQEFKTTYMSQKNVCSHTSNKKYEIHKYTL